MNEKIILYVGVILLTFGACKTPKKVTEPVKAKIPQSVETPSANAMVLKTVTINQNNWNLYYSRGSANYKDKDLDQDLNLEIQMEKDKYIYVNVTVLFGVPAARIWFTRDSICILDMLHRKCIITDYAYLRAMTDVSLKFPQMQAMLSGNPMFNMYEKEVIIDSLLGQILITSQLKPGQSQTTSVKASNFKVSKLTVSDKNLGRDLRLEYTECYNQGSNCFPKDFNINIRAENNVECRVSLDYFAFDNKKEVKFAIPKSFKIVRI